MAEVIMFILSMFAFILMVISGVAIYDVVILKIKMSMLERRTIKVADEIINKYQKSSETDEKTVKKSDKSYK